MVHRLMRWVAWFVVVGMAALGFAIAAAAQDLSFSAKVDRTTVDMGDPITLILTVSGDLAGAKLEDLQLPEGIIVAAQSQATSFSIRAGAMERSMNLTYVLVAQQAGTFQIGPFSLTQGGKQYQTETIELTVTRPALPPSLKQHPQGERYLL